MPGKRITRAISQTQNCLESKIRVARSQSIPHSFYTRLQNAKLLYCMATNIIIDLGSVFV